MPEFKHVGAHVETLDAGQMVAPGDIFEVTGEQAAMPRFQDLLKEGVVISTAGAPQATDAAEKLAEEEGVELASVVGTGVDGTITKGDVEAYLASQEEKGGK